MTPQQIRNEVEQQKREIEEYSEGYQDGFKHGYLRGRTQTTEKVKEMIELFKDDSIYTGRIVKFEIKNRMFSKIGDNCICGFTRETASNPNNIHNRDYPKWRN